MRLFTAIELGETVGSKAAAIVSSLRRRVEKSAPDARVTWIPEDRMHLTVRFIGEVDDSLAERIIGALREPLPLAPFTIGFGSLGAFPPKGPPRVLWMGVVDGREALVHVESAISDRLRAVGVPKDDRPYSPHLTMARVRESAGLRSASLFEGLTSDVGLTRVEAITLFQSRLSPKGPTYAVLEKTALGAAEDGQ